jgi:hypothetical protein
LGTTPEYMSSIKLLKDISGRISCSR